ncbi:S-type pyocin domain-containing protein [Pseudomonas fluorescens]|uniref:S-type pyocin domain-containing protein n=1 Tax=Pseudomonas fluorescens TaxID=294 RepID=UPI0007D06B52|nr:S-type pyocin domain-containing protein [Pseudomonas fluorescens]
MPKKPQAWELDEAVHTTAPAPKNVPISPATGTTIPNSGMFGPPRNTGRYQQVLQNFTGPLEAEYQGKTAQIPVTIEADLAAARQEISTHPLPPAASLIRELGVRNTVIERKTRQLQHEIKVSHGFYGSDPTDKTVFQFLSRAQIVDRILSPNGPGMNLWKQSYRAALEARLLAQTLTVLHQQQANVHNWLTTVQANEQAQAAAAEAARQAAEHARIAAEQQRQQALADAARRQREQEEAQRAAAERDRLAAEQALLARQAQAKREAEAEAEQARIQRDEEAQRLREQSQAQKKAKRKRQQQARRAAQAEAKLAAQNKRQHEQWQAQSDARWQSPTFANVGSMAAFDSTFSGTLGHIATSQATSLALRTALRTAVSIVSAAAAPVLVGFAALLIPSRLGSGDLYSASVPLAELAPDLNAVDLYEQAANGKDVDLPARLGSRTIGNRVEIVIVGTDGVTVPANVPVRLARFDAGKNVYVSGDAEAKGPTLTWTPLVLPLNPSTDLPFADTDLPIYEGATATPQGGRVDPFPELDQYGFGGFITVFPIESGIPPTFTMFRDRRQDPGVATGNGQVISGNWLGAASTPEGAPIPAQIADKLRGREFSSFKAFRRAFWKAMGQDEMLSAQFTKLRQTDMRKKLAPTAVPQEQVGKRAKLEIHHHDPISEGGEVYNMDNLKVMTPRAHIKIHKKTEDQ